MNLFKALSIRIEIPQFHLFLPTIFINQADQKSVSA